MSMSCQVWQALLCESILESANQKQLWGHGITRNDEETSNENVLLRQELQRGGVAGSEPINDLFNSDNRHQRNNR